jgi:hypothetical protein
VVHNVHKLGIYYGVDSILGFGAHFRVGVRGRPGGGAGGGYGL